MSWWCRSMFGSRSVALAALESAGREGEAGAALALAGALKSAQIAATTRHTRKRTPLAFALAFVFFACIVMAATHRTPVSARAGDNALKISGG